MAAVGSGNALGMHDITKYHPVKRALQTNDILLKTFSFLSVQDLKNCFRVSSLWNRVANYELLWKNQISQDVIDNFSSLVEEKSVHWKEVRFLYGRLAQFIARLIEDRISTQSFIRKENPELSESDFPAIEMPRPLAVHGNYVFSILRTTYIKISEKNKVEPSFPTILEGEDNKILTHLVVEGDYLFALRKDGKIIQWDYKKKEKIQEIDTAYSKGDEEFRRQRAPFWGYDGCFCENGSFCIKNGMIVIQNSSDDNSIKQLEIIPYADPKKSQLIEDSTLIGSSSRIMIEKERIIIMGRHSIWIWNLLTNRREALLNLVDIDSSYMLRDIAIDQNILYATETVSTDATICRVHTVNLKTRKKDCFHYPALEARYSSIGKIVVIHNLLFGLSYEKGFFYRIFVFNINSKIFVNLKPVRIDYRAEEVESDVLKELIMLSKPVIAKKTTQTIQKSSKKSSMCIIS